MLVAVPVALLVLAQAASAEPQGPPAPPPPPPPAETQSSDADADCTRSTSETRDIIVCAQRPRSYRLNPDVMAAKRDVRSAGRPAPPGGAGVTAPCGSVGPQGCQSGGISPLAVILTAAEMAKRVAEGKEIGSMFVTDPHPSEYQLYLMAKKRREAREQAEKDAIAAAKAKAAVAAQGASNQLQPPSSAAPQPQDP